MSLTPIGEPRHKITTASLREQKLRHEPITCLTAYDYAAARLIDEAGIEMVLVGDSLAQTMLGYENTLSVTMDEMLHHVKAVRRGLKNALLAADMPYGSYQIDPKTALSNAARFVKEGGAEMVKVEGGDRRGRERLLDAGVPEAQRSGARDLVIALRSLLRYLHVAGLIELPLVWAVPGVADLRDRSLPRGLEPAVVARLLASCDRRRTVGRRDYAILLLLVAARVARRRGRRDQARGRRLAARRAPDPRQGRPSGSAAAAGRCRRGARGLPAPPRPRRCRAVFLR